MGNRKKFLETLYSIIEDKEFTQIIQWTSNGKTVVLVSPIEFEIKVMPNYFHSVNIKSFYRQLSSYGFQVKSNKQKGKQFFHKLFFKGNYYQISKIERQGKLSCKSSSFLDEYGHSTEELMKTLEKLSKQQSLMFIQLRKHTQIQAIICNNISSTCYQMQKQCDEDQQQQCDSFFQNMIRLFKGFQVDIATTIFSELKEIGGPATPAYSPLLFQYHEQL